MPATTSGQQLLLPNANRSPNSRNQLSVLIEVTSRDRNYLQQLSSNPIKFQFARPLKDVRSVELISGTIPAYPYNVISGANSFLIQEGNQEFTISISPGYYTKQTLLQKIQTIFSSLGGTNTYTVSLVNDKLSIVRDTGTDSFGLLFFSTSPPDEIDRSDGGFLKQNTLALQLGFDLSDYWDTAGTLTSPYPVDPQSSINRLYLYINMQNSTDLGAIERGAGRRSPFAIIYLDEDKNGYKYLNKDTLSPMFFSLPQPLSRLQTLTIDFRDEWYRPVNFDGKDFSLLFEFVMLE